MREGSFAFRVLKLEPRMWAKRKLAAVGGAGVVLLVAAAAALGPVVRSRAERVAKAHGMTVQIDSVWPALGGVRLKNVRFRAGDPEWLSGELATVDVGLGWTLAPRTLRVRGGKIMLSGSVDEVSQRLRDYNKPQADQASAKSTGLDLHVEGLKVSWRDSASSESFDVDGLAIERVSKEDRQRGELKAAAFQIKKGLLSAKAREMKASFARYGGLTQWQEARLNALEVELPLGGASAMSVDDRAAAAGAAHGFLERARALQSRLIEAASWAEAHLVSDAPVEVEGLSVLLTRGDQSLNIGPGRLSVGHRDGGVDVDFAPGQSADKAAADRAGVRVRAHVPTSAGEINAYVEGGPVTLASLGVHERDFGLLDVGHAKLELKGKISLSPDAERLSFDGSGRVQSLSLLHRALADDPVKNLDLGWRAAGAAGLDGSLFRIDEAKLDLGAIRLEGFGSIENAKDYVRIDARALVPVSDCEKMFESIPAALVPKLVGMKMAGPFSLKTGFTLDTRHPDDMKIDWDLKNRCRITSVPSDIDVVRFTRPFRRNVYDERGEKVEILSGPGTPDWVPLRAISPFLEAAVTTTEDGGFRYHGGFDKTAIQNSIRDNLRAGKFLRGASTITMQLAKNLYLEREKNLSRKLQEAVLTTYLEQALTKDDILELYFNIVEFGPMIYGIGPAADHYFDTSPYDLSLGQALFLSSILPSPKRTYFSPSGQVSKGWLGYLHKLMKIMRDRKKISDQELIDGISEVITYKVAHSPRVRPAGDIRKELGGEVPWMAPEGP